MRKAVYIEWKDSVLYSKWLSQGEVRDSLKEEAIMRTLGFLVDEDPDFYIVSQSVFGDKSGANLKIPKIAVDRIISLDLVAVGVTAVLVGVVSAYSLLGMSQRFVSAVAQVILDDVEIIISN